MCIDTFIEKVKKIKEKNKISTCINFVRNILVLNKL